MAILLREYYAARNWDENGAPNGPFWPVLRTYGPGKAILDKTLKFQQVK
jgi:hypothetical protein